MVSVRVCFALFALACLAGQQHTMSVQPSFCASWRLLPLSASRIYTQYSTALSHAVVAQIDKQPLHAALGSLVSRGIDRPAMSESRGMEAVESCLQRDRCLVTFDEVVSFSVMSLQAPRDEVCHRTSARPQRLPRRRTPAAAPARLVRLFNACFARMPINAEMSTGNERGHCVLYFLQFCEHTYHDTSNVHHVKVVNHNNTRNASDVLHVLRGTKLFVMCYSGSTSAWYL